MYKCKSKSGGIKRVVDDSVVIGKVLTLLALLVQKVRFTGTPAQILAQGERFVVSCTALWWSVRCPLYLLF